MMHGPQGHFDRIKATGRLPSPKGVALEVVRLANDPNAGVTQLRRVIQGDPALSGRIAQAANSAGIGLRYPVLTVDDAICILGFRQVRELALAISLVSSNSKGACGEFDYQGFWSHSLVGGLSSYAIAARLGTAGAEEVFACGLLSGVGRLAFATVYPMEYAEILRNVRAADDDTKHTSLVELERQQFGINHVELTGEMLADWGFPALYIEAVTSRRQAEPSRLEPGTRTYLLALEMSLAAHFTEYILAAPEARPGLLPALMAEAEKLGLDSVAMQALSEHILTMWRGWARLINVTVPDTGALFERESALQD